MKKMLIILTLATWSATGCSKPSTPAPAVSPAPAANEASTSPVTNNDAVQRKLVEFSGGSGTDCGRLDVKAAPEQLKTASSCATEAAQNKHPFYVAYDMPGMSIGVAGNSEGKLFTAQSQGDDASLTSGACPAPIRVASSGRVSCFAPGDMGSMGTGHQGGMPAGKVPNPHGTGTPPK